MLFCYFWNFHFSNLWKKVIWHRNSNVQVKLHSVVAFHNCFLTVLLFYTFNKSYPYKILGKQNSKIDDPYSRDKWSVLLENFRSKKPLPIFLSN